MVLNAERDTVTVYRKPSSELDQAARVIAARHGTTLHLRTSPYFWSELERTVDEVWARREALRSRGVEL
ncbi:MAG: hypothetical protein M3P96_14865, partial [Actinomycetota bacterium]|nr:hypothetical protein [Actinomycetota bacterium]